jgi:prolipoprotein diacylglyceryl transferase
MSVEVLAQYFHWYGFIVGVAVVVTWLVVEHLLGQEEARAAIPGWLFGMVGALGGARLWHIATDWHLYYSLPWLDLLWQICAVWQGGLSILGALCGGLIGLLVARWWGGVSSKSVLVLLDSLAIAMPFGQAIGRMANYVNQELYGAPTTMPWGIFIEPAYRVVGFENVEKFHPLFAYEALLLVAFGSWLYLRHYQHRVPWGTGRLWWWYVLYYLVIRFGLDFVRIDKSMFTQLLSINQVMVLGGIVIVAGYQVYLVWIAKK